jgi:thymidylate synthase
MNTYSTIHDAYLGTLQDIYFNYDYRAAPRGLPVREKTDYTFRVLNPVNEPIVTKDPERNKVIEDYTRKETELYNSCTNRVEDFAKASKFWEKLQNPDGTVNSAYGYLIWKKKSHGNSNFDTQYPLDEEPVHCGYGKMRTPWEWAKQSLIHDKDTRQAILRFSLPEHQWMGNKDQTCTLHGNFLIREDKLNFTIVMRSNDMMLGLVYDLPWFVSLMDRMVDELKPTYPSLTKGIYTHAVHSMHIYERDAEKVLKMLGTPLVQLPNGQEEPNNK